ncbi:hypothetical protein AB833_21490 [Chromatiales bacterium (ex Bugula neritina AB1)]|nr:hypothetical protein AB833_21490 [Chromatiales bacterium (ex Bugula neritina AB1)]
MKRVLITVLLMGLTTPVSGNGGLNDLIAELEHIKRMVAQQATVQPHQRFVFRYDLVEQRIDTLIEDIEKHLTLISMQPRVELIEEPVSR